MSSRQPNSRHCFVCGVANPVGLHLIFVEKTPGEVTAEVTLPAHYQGYPGIVHGGIIAAMLDEVAGRSQMNMLGQTNFMFTLKLDVRYRKNVPTGQPLKLVGKALERRNRSATAHGAIYNQAGELLAEADCVLVRMPQEMFDDVDLSALGWRIYQDDELTAAQVASVQFPPVP